MLRRLVALARSANTREISNLTDLGCFAGKEQRRYLSELPKEYQGYYQRQLLQPKRPPRASPVPAEEAAAASEDASTSSREDSPADVQLQSAQAGDFLRCAFTSPLIPACIPKPPTSQEQTEYEGPAQVITLSGLAKCNMSELPLLLTNIYTVCALIDAHASLQILSYTSTKRLLLLAASAWMFPWEKRQMDGTQQPLRTWEKLYWGVFVTALAGLLFSRLFLSEKPEPKVILLHALC